MTEFTACPFTVIVDSREQSSYDFRTVKSDAKDGNLPFIVPTIRRALKTGDYSVEGFEDTFAVERKELGDLFHCMGSDRERFERQLERLNELSYSAVVVEADLARIRRGHDRSKLNPKTVFRSVISYQVDRFPNVQWWFPPGKLFAEHITFRILQRCWKQYAAEAEKA